MAFKTEFAFTLPRGYVDKNGNVHKEGVMRLATAKDEILPLQGPPGTKQPSFTSLSFC